MTQTIFYICLDLIGTVSEMCLLYACTDIFCKRNDRVILRLFPYISTALLICAMTWLIPLGAIKTLVFAVYFVVVQRFILKEYWHRLIMAFSLFFILLIISDFACLVVTDAVLGHTSVMVGNNVVNVWQYFLLKFIVIGVIIFSLYKGFRNFSYQVQRRDTAIILSYGVITYLVLYYSTGKGFFSGDVNYFDFTIGISGLLLGVLLLLLFLYQKNSNYLKLQKSMAQQQIREMELKYAYYEDKFKDEERVREIYHDLKNHLLILQTQQAHNAESQQMIASLQEQISAFEDYQHTGNEFLDIIIRDKAKKAKEKNIDFSAVIRFEEIDFIAPLDISTIFGNAIDNALEASLKLPADERVVTVKANRFRDMLSIVIKNNCLTTEDAGLTTTKDDLFLHGFGLKNIRQAVEKYGGQLAIHQEQDSFILKIIIPIP